MAHLNPVIKESVGFLCADLPGEDGKEPTPLGTCFFVRAENSAGEHFDYLVTARHVVDALRKAGGTTYVRLNRGTKEQRREGVVYLPLGRADKENWLIHKDKNVDLAVLAKRPEPPRVGEPDLAYRFLLLPLRDLETVSERAVDAGFPWPPLEGEDVTFVAMMIQFLGSATNQPVARHGNIALVTEEQLKGTYGLADYYVIESQAYPGNSGALVYVIYGERLLPLGVLTFAYPGLEELTQMQGTSSAYYNLGLSLVVPIEKVVEILNSDTETERREKGVDEAERGIALSGMSEDPVEFTKDAFREALRRVSRHDGKEVIEKRDQASSQT